MNTSEDIHTSEIWLPRSSTPDLIIPKPQMPNDRFFCSECGSQDVFRQTKIFSLDQKTTCLNCNFVWSEAVNS